MAPSMTSRPRPSRALAAVAVGVLLLLGLAACGDDDDGVSAGASDTTTTAASGGDAGDDGYGGTTGGASDESYIEAKDFSLTSITVAPGAEVEVENEGDSPHTATADDGAFDSDRVEPGSSGSFTAPAEPGDYPFHCEIHPAMTATLTVEG
jgi:plastocyanin